MPIAYPKPSEVGADRLLTHMPFSKISSSAIVIDLGTATTSDVITAKGGYVGGVIVPDHRDARLSGK